MTRSAGPGTPPSRRLPTPLPAGRGLRTAPPWRAVGLAVLLLSPLPRAWAQADAANQAVAVAKKLELLQRYLESPSSEKIASGDNGAAQELLARARERGAEAMRAFEKGEMTRAGDRMNEAFRAYTEALEVQRRKGAGYAEIKQRNAALREEITAYRQAFDEALKEKGPAAAGLLNGARVDELLLESVELEKSGNPSGAQERLKEANNMVVAALTRIRQNETVVYTLDFRTPADEYRYEQNRHQSYAMLVEQMRQATELGEKALELARRYAEAGDKLRLQAEAEAGTGQYEQAIKTMEEANRQLVRALQMMGLSIPG
ncbi:MAG TPA: hypothetical protein VIW02_04085 [Gammaproteobacteria bacterium]